MTRSVEIPDAAVEAAAKAVSLDWRNYVASMRVALVAARPYLMPTRETIEQRIQRVYIDGGANVTVAQEAAADIATEMLALLNGES